MESTAMTMMETINRAFLLESARFDEVSPPGKDNRCRLCGHWIGDDSDHSVACSRNALHLLKKESNVVNHECDHDFVDKTNGDGEFPFAKCEKCGKGLSLEKALSWAMARIRALKGG
jgi:hypothetical protein